MLLYELRNGMYPSINGDMFAGPDIVRQELDLGLGRRGHGVLVLLSSELRSDLESTFMHTNRKVSLSVLIG